MITRRGGAMAGEPQILTSCIELRSTKSYMVLSARETRWSVTHLTIRHREHGSRCTANLQLQLDTNVKLADSPHRSTDVPSNRIPCCSLAPHRWCLGANVEKAAAVLKLPSPGLLAGQNYLRWDGAGRLVSVRRGSWEEDPFLSLEERTRGAPARAEVEPNPPRDSHRRLPSQWTG
jgi:hypothetical protein